MKGSKLHRLSGFGWTDSNARWPRRTRSGSWSRLESAATVSSTFAPYRRPAVPAIDL